MSSEITNIEYSKINPTTCKTFNMTLYYDYFNYISSFQWYIWQCFSV